MPKIILIRGMPGCYKSQVKLIVTTCISEIILLFLKRTENNIYNSPDPIMHAHPHTIL